MSTYAWVDIGAVSVPLLFSFHPRSRFHQRWSAFVPAILGTLGLFIPWDALFTQAGIWGFRPEHVGTAHFLHLPLEEWLFFVCIPYACLFSYHCFHVLGLQDPFGRRVKAISAVLAVGLLITGLLHHQRAYTCSALVGCAVWIAFTAFVQKAGWLGRFYVSYALLLLPFLVVNGILTGTGLTHEVVWYNEAHIIGPRILTIPIEDVFYGLLLVGLTVSIYEAILGRSGEQTAVRVH
jgi:lycopene cyclase domain-containing protein